MPASSVGGSEAPVDLPSGEKRTLLGAILDAQKPASQVYYRTRTYRRQIRPQLAALRVARLTSRVLANACYRAASAGWCTWRDWASATTRQSRTQVTCGPIPRPAAAPCCCAELQPSPPFAEWSERAVGLATGGTGEGVTGMMIVYPTCLVQCIEVSGQVPGWRMQPPAHSPLGQPSAAA